MLSKIRGVSSFRIVMYIHLAGFVVSFFGCAQIFSKSGWEDTNLCNYALASHGGSVSVSGGSMGSSGGADTLNNGITSSERWGRGEGWECPFSGSIMSSARSVFRDDESRVRNTAMGWAIVEFADVINLSRVVIYTVDSETYPANKYGVRDVGIYFQADDNSPWLPVTPYVTKIGLKSGRIYGNESGVIDVRISQRQARRIRVLVEETNDTKALSPWRRYIRSDAHQWLAVQTRNIEGTVRIVEIEAYGTGEDIIESPDSSAGSDADFSADLSQLFGQTEFSNETVWLGIRGQEISSDAAKELGLVSDYGILLLELAEGSPAAAKRAEIKIGERKMEYRGVEYPVDSDILVDIDGSGIRENADIRRVLATKETEDIVELGIISSNGQRKKVSIRLGVASKK